MVLEVVYSKLLEISMRVPVIMPALHTIPALLVMVYLIHFCRVILLTVAGGKYDNTLPRASTEKSTKKLVTDVKDAKESALLKAAKRAEGAHYNTIEAFAYHSVSILMAVVTNKINSNDLDHLANLFLLIRVAYFFIYLFGVNQAIAATRSLVFITGLSVSIAIMVRCAPLH